MADRSRPSPFLRALTWVSALVLVAGVIAVITVWVGGGEESGVVHEGETVPIELPDEPAPSADDVPAAARKVAGEFILAAAAREDLAKGWKLAHPDLKKQCGCTYEEWLTGNIPVIFFPVSGLDTARFGVNEASPRRVVLEVALTPKPDSELPDTAFYIGLKAVGTGENTKWLVDYWAPIGSPPVPQAQ